MALSSLPVFAKLSTDMTLDHRGLDKNPEAWRLDYWREPHSGFDHAHLISIATSGSTRDSWMQARCMSKGRDLELRVERHFATQTEGTDPHIFF